MNITIWNKLSNTERNDILNRPKMMDAADKRKIVSEIIGNIKVGGDTSLVVYTLQYDGIKISNLEVSTSEFQEAALKVSPESKRAITFAKTNLEKNHRTQIPLSQKTEICEGVTCERQARPIEKVGLYIPAGTAPLISTLLMLAVPAKLAGCELIIVCSPPDENGKIDPNILYAAEICGIKKVFKAGGAQAIAAMAYGTITIPKVDKIFGPGNSWVTQAKMLVAEDPAGARIDMPAGPSELMVIADEQANAAYIAADLLSQAEHGVDSQVILITTSKGLATSVNEEILTQSAALPRVDIINQSLMYSRIIIVDNIDQALQISNCYAPEHLILQVNEPKQYISSIKNAGAVFLGKWTPETVGDYVTGSNHVLPTYGYAKTYSGLSVADFVKYISFQTVTREGLTLIGPYAEQLASLENLMAHKQAVTLRLTEKVVL